MSETPVPKNASFLRKKVAGVPVIYPIAGFVVVLVFIAWRMKGPAADSVDAANPSGSSDSESTNVEGALPNLPQGTVVASSAPVQPEDAPYEDNSTWLRKSVAFLIAHGVNPGEAQLALQHYLAGSDLSYQEGHLRDLAVKEYGLPPDNFDAGKTASKPAYTTASASPVPVKPAPKPVAVPVKVEKPKPAPPKTRYYIVRKGDTLSKIGTMFHIDWHKIYAVNKGVIGSNPNLIKPGQRLVIPYK